MSVLPPLYATWIEKVLSGKTPSESNATCDRCAMCTHPDDRPEKTGLFFNPEAKCCTYLPELYNFLVGGILVDGDPALAEGRASVEARLEAKVEVTPLGLGRSPAYTLLYTHASSAFGLSRSLRCPHYIEKEGGRCGIWQHRNAVCATWFCKHERGATGLKFWRTLLQLLTRVEVGLSRWCVLELDIGSRALEGLFSVNSANPEGSKLDANQIDQVANLENYRLLWGKWLGRECEFYQECVRLVNGLSWEDITCICGPDVRVFIRLTQEAYDRLASTKIPESVRLNAIQIIGVGLDSVRVKTYSPYDPLKLPRKLLEVLPYLETQCISEALHTIEVEKGLRLSEALVRKLIDFDILRAESEGDLSCFAEIPNTGKY